MLGPVDIAGAKIGRVQFVDGVKREVFEDAEVQYVHGDDGEKVRGVWILPEVDDGADKPLIVPEAGWTSERGRLYQP